jgi:GT2 family glycosyltransferase
MPVPAVAITIPTLLGGAMLDRCLRALGRQTFKDFEVVIVNNGAGNVNNSGGGAAGLDTEPFALSIRVISPGANLGFGAAVNLAVRATETRYIATLNDDTEPDPGWLQALVSELDSDPRVGMCASSIRLVEPDRLDSAGMMICFDGSSKQRGRNLQPAFFAHSDDVLLPSACAALYKRELLDQVGLFDEDFFLYCEDTDLGLRARWAGWRCRYAASASVRHHYSTTAGAFSHLKARFTERNRLWVAIKNFPIALLPAAVFVSFLRYFWQFHAIRNKKGMAARFMEAGGSMWSACAILLGAYRETAVCLPALMRKRALICATHKIGSAEFIRLLYRYHITAKDLACA